MFVERVLTEVVGKDVIVGSEMQILKRLGFNMQVSPRFNCLFRLSSVTHVSFSYFSSKTQACSIPLSLFSCLLLTYTGRPPIQPRNKLPQDP